MSVNRQPIHADMERAVRRKGYYGCVCCGCPIVDYHHIIPYSDVKEHTEENLVALCCNCHRDVHSGVISDRRLRQAISNPYNKQHQFVAHQFSLGDPLIRRSGDNQGKVVLSFGAMKSSSFGNC